MLGGSLIIYNTLNGMLLNVYNFFIDFQRTLFRSNLYHEIISNIR
jgi:hypothetical protein